MNSKLSFNEPVVAPVHDDLGHTPPTITVGVFDSGVGGLSILAAIQASFAQSRHGCAVRFVYCLDNGNFPYGTKSDDEVCSCVQTVTEALIQRYAVDVLVVACNTASTIALPRLRSTYSVPVVGVVPAIKPAAAQSQSRVIGLLATPATVRRPYTDALIDSFAADCQVVRVGSVHLVGIAEAKARGESFDDAAVLLEMAPLFVPGLDTVVLGCTHFPLLKAEFERLAPWPVAWVDSARAVAERLAKVVETLTPRPRPKQPNVAVFTRQGAELQRLAPFLATYALTSIETL